MTAESVQEVDVAAVNSKAARTERQSLYASRVRIHPKRATGSFRKLKWWIMALTLGVYYLTPLLRWDRGPSAPDQAVLIDFVNRKFYFFFIEIWPHEFVFVAGLLFMAAMGLFVMTSMAGRVWCGYTCPQTVWTDLFIAVERWVEGDRNARIKLDKAPMSVSKARKRVTKHSIWLLIAMGTGGAWVFYFADAPTLMVDLVTFQAHQAAYITVGVLTFTTYVLGALMREQVCTYMCPWPRVQGALLDEDSLVITYRDWRGEPRGKHTKRRAAEAQTTPLEALAGQATAAASGAAVRTQGDCIDCNQCVAVCPMGIDIRDGQQLECITCALCIDACDEVMAKLDKPKGLIAYDTYRNNEARARGESVPPLRVFRPRTLLYTGLWCAMGVALLVGLFTRDNATINVLHDRNPVYVLLSDGAVRNGYTVRLLNMARAPRDFTLALEGLDGAQLRLGTTGTFQETLIIPAQPSEVVTAKVYVSAHGAQALVARNDVRFIATTLDGTEVAEVSVFRGPGQ